MKKSSLLYLVLGIFLIAGAYWLISIFVQSRPISQGQHTLAYNGVEVNQAWQPIIRRVTGVKMVLVPAGCFEMGSTEQQLIEAERGCKAFYGPDGCQEGAFENEQPAHQVCISEPYWFDLTAVTNFQYGNSSNLGKENSPSKDWDWPRETVTWQMATDFCSSRGGRLPTEAEWEFAARGPDALIYPFGNDYQIEKVTLQKVSPVAVGQKPDGASWVGALDMSGGVGEWVSDWYGPYINESITDPRGPSEGEYRIVRGGDWFSHSAHFVRTTWRQPLLPDYATSVIGFRCVVPLEPED